MSVESFHRPPVVTHMVNQTFYRAYLPWPRRRPRTPVQQWFASMPDDVQRELDSGCPDLLGPGMRHETPLDIARAFTADGPSVLGKGSVNVLYLAQSADAAIAELAERVALFLRSVPVVNNAVPFELRELHVRSSDVQDIRGVDSVIGVRAGDHQHIAEEARTSGHDSVLFNYDIKADDQTMLGVFDLSIITHYGTVRSGTMHYSDVQMGFTHYHWEPEPIPMQHALPLGNLQR